MKTLLLVSPLAENSSLGGDFFFRLPALGLLKVASLTPDEWRVTICDEKVETLDFARAVDLVGISAMTPAVNRGYEIADRFRARGVPVVMGGMHVTKLPDEALAHCDAVVIGEAEELWPRLLADLERGELRRVYRHEGGYPSLAGLPLPDWRLFKDKRYMPVHFVETTRGCPHDCEFCAVTSSFGGRFRSRPPEEVEEEIRTREPFPSRFKLDNVVFFVDDNIIGNRRHARDLLSRLAPYELRWLGQASVAIADDAEMLGLCRASGCIGLLVGFESLSSDTLAKANKRFNQPQRFVDVVRKLHDHGIGVDGAFVFGFDDDDEGVFDRTAEFVVKAKLDACYFSILTPYPGTALHARLAAEGRIVDTDWSNYNTNNVVFRPRGMSPERLLAGYHEVLRESYSWPSIFRRLFGNGTSKQFFYPMNFGFRRTFMNVVRRERRPRAEP